MDTLKLSAINKWLNPAFMDALLPYTSNSFSINLATLGMTVHIILDSMISLSANTLTGIPKNSVFNLVLNKAF